MCAGAFEHAHGCPYAVHTLAHVRLAAVEQPIGLAVGRANHFDLARGDGITQFRQGIGRFHGHLLVADAVEIDVSAAPVSAQKWSMSRTEPGST